MTAESDRRRFRAAREDELDHPYGYPTSYHDWRLTQRKRNPIFRFWFWWESRRLRQQSAGDERLRELGDALAAAVEERWTGPGGCDCKVCTAAQAWRSVRAEGHGR